MKGFGKSQNAWFIEAAEYVSSQDQVKFIVKNKINKKVCECMDMAIYDKFSGNEIMQWVQDRNVYHAMNGCRLTIVTDIKKHLKRHQLCQIMYEGKVLLSNKRWYEVAAMFPSSIGAKPPTSSIKLDKLVTDISPLVLQTLLNCVFENALHTLKDSFKWSVIDNALSTLETLGIQKEMLNADNIRQTIVDKMELGMEDLNQGIIVANSIVAKEALIAQRAIMTKKFEEKRQYWIKNAHLLRGSVRRPIEDTEESIKYHWKLKIDEFGELAFTSEDNCKAIKNLFENLNPEDGPWIAETLQKSFAQIASQLWDEQVNADFDLKRIVQMFIEEFGDEIAGAPKCDVPNDAIWDLIKIDLSIRIQQQDMEDWCILQPAWLSRLSLDQHKILINRMISDHCDEFFMNPLIVGLMTNFFKIKKNQFDEKEISKSIRNWIKFIFQQFTNKEAGDIIVDMVQPVESTEAKTDIVLNIVEYFLHDYDMSHVKPRKLVDLVTKTLGFGGWDFNASLY